MTDKDAPSDPSLQDATRLVSGGRSFTVLTREGQHALGPIVADYLQFIDWQTGEGYAYQYRPPEGRNIVKLILDRRRRIMGSRLRTRLVAAFVAIALLPATLLFLVALSFVGNSIEDWFNGQVESALEGSLEVAHAYYQDLATTALGFARQTAIRVAQEKLNDPARRDDLRKFLAERRSDYQLDMVEVFAHPEHVPLWHAAMRNEPVDWSDLFDGYQATVDWPGAAVWREISVAYPDALVLLSTRRTSDEWYASASRTGTVSVGPASATTSQASCSQRVPSSARAR